MIDQLLIVGLFACLVASLIFTDWPAVWVFTCSMLAAYFVGLVDTADVLSKASNSGLITLVLLLLVSVGLEKLSWLSRLSGQLVTESYTFSLLRLGAVTAFFSAFVNNTAVVATLAHSVRSNKHHPASRLLIPLSYAAILGGTMTLIGTSTNLIVSSFLEDVTGTGLDFFDFFAIGATATGLGLVALVFSARLLPATEDDAIDITEYLIEAEVDPDSALVGKSITENKLRDLEDLFLVELVRGEHLISPVAPQEFIEAGDKLIFSGDINQVSTLDEIDGLRLFAIEEGLLRENMIEVIVMPNATIEGKTIKDSGFRSLFDAAVVGMRRGGKRLSGKLGNITIQAGDNMMLAVGADFNERKNLGKNFVVVDESVGGVKTTPLQNYLITAVLLVVIVLATTGIVPLIKGMAFLLVTMLMMKVVRGSELRRRFPFEIWLIIASALTLSQALTNTGVVGVLANFLHEHLAVLGPWAALAGIYFGTLLLTEMMTNNAAAALAFPIAFGLAESYGLSHMPFIMAVAYGASASFLTPYGYTTNLMVQNLGGYGLNDYFRAGLPLSVVYSLVVLVLIPRLFPF
ncbi:SLC13 family permease [Pseudohalioglobus lutimaris]|uniref:SLC13 family permease n=1 Tax=Pseudohalioglobus lutimaris TaxID=1737061 RepID=A0A2N5X2Q3_9GAMM|nr:SLC13 family permease [Pseudohalioglobus lutimaris]PLW68771.1 SLC13 family permease [Pseudohalioglobus lutimaris]